MSLASLLFTHHCHSYNRAAPLDKLVKALLDNAPFDGPLVESALASTSLSSRNDPFSLLEKWREFLALMIVLRLRDSLPAYLPIILKRMRQLRSLTIWPEFQLLALYQSLGAYLVGAEDDFPKIFQLPSGACPLDASGIWAWGDVPQPALHAEMGILLAYYASLAEHAPALECAVKIAEWQKNTFDFYYDPFDGLLALEGGSCENALLVNNCLLFDAVAKLTKRTDLAAVADKLGRQLQEHISGGRFVVHPHAVVLSRAFQGDLPHIDSGYTDMSTCFVDPNFALAGCRETDCSAVATLFGGGSGMGCFHGRENKVISYGPQHLPLGECSGFGLEGGARLLSGQVRHLTSSQDNFLVEGVSRMVPAGVKDRFSAAMPGGIWMESRQAYRNGALEIETDFEALEMHGPLAFSFFVKSASCLVEGQRAVKPRSLNRYLGPSALLTLEGSGTSLSIVSGQKHEEMHVIPLSGGGNFWGADFLVAYILPQGESRFSWKVSNF